MGGGGERQEGGQRRLVVREERRRIPNGGPFQGPNPFFFSFLAIEGGPVQKIYIITLFYYFNFYLFLKH
jgi:hypothetical protein